MNCFVTNNTNQIRHWMEKEIIKYLINKYKNNPHPILIKPDSYSYLEVADLDVDIEFLKVVFRGFSEIRVGASGFHVLYS